VLLDKFVQLAGKLLEVFAELPEIHVAKGVLKLPDLSVDLLKTQLLG